MDWPFPRHSWPSDTSNIVPPLQYVIQVVSARSWGRPVALSISSCLSYVQLPRVLAFYSRPYCLFVYVVSVHVWLISPIYVSLFSPVKATVIVIVLITQDNVVFPVKARVATCCWLLILLVWILDDYTILSEQGQGPLLVYNGLLLLLLLPIPCVPI